jgi:ABC-type sugar transport system substrate-binding protein
MSNKKSPERVSRSTFMVFVALFVVIFGALVGRTLWELSVIGRAIDPPWNARYRIEHHFALLIPALDHDLFYRRSTDGMREVFEREHAVFEIFEYPDGELGEIRRILRLILNTIPDGVLLSFPYDSSFDELLEAFQEKGIPLVTLEYDTPRRDAYVGTNPFSLGRLAGEAAAALSPGGSAAILLAGGDTAFIQGFRQVILEDGSLSIGMIRSRDDTLAAGEELIREILSFRRDITVAVFTGSREAEGAAWALLEYGRIGTPLIIASGDNPEIKRLLEMGVVSASIVRNPEEAGRAAAEALCALARDERTNAYIDPGSSILWEKTASREAR